MSQFQFPVIDPQITSGTELANYLNSWVPAIQSQHSGVARPAYAVEGLLWLDKSGGAAGWKLRFFDGAQDIEIGRIDSVANGFRPSVDGKVPATADDCIAYAIALG